MLTAIERAWVERSALMSALIIQAFLECDDKVQQHILESIAIVNDPAGDGYEQEQALATIQAALFPSAGSIWARNSAQPLKGART